MCKPVAWVQEIGCKSLHKVTGVTGKSRAEYYTRFGVRHGDSGNHGRLAENRVASGYEE